jgi:nicotinamide riboside kinase
VEITMSVTLAPELAEAIKESAERHGVSFDDWIAAAAELKFHADDEAAIFEEADRKRRAAGLREYLDEYQAEFGAFTDEEMAETRRQRLEAHRLAEEAWARREAEDA